MRTLLLPLAVGSLLALGGSSRAEWDSAGVGPAKVKAIQSPGGIFDGGMAATRPAQKGVLLVDHLACVRFCVVARVRLFDVSVPQPTIKNPSNIPRPKR